MLAAVVTQHEWHEVCRAPAAHCQLENRVKRYVSPRGKITLLDIPSVIDQASVILSKHWFVKYRLINLLHTCREDEMEEVSNTHVIEKGRIGGKKRTAGKD